jgi:hypothetical protein
MGFESKLCNCNIIPRNDEKEPLFHVNEKGDVLCSLDGYTIIPNEQYGMLVNQSETGTKNT